MWNAFRAAIEASGYLDFVSAFTLETDRRPIRDFIATEVPAALASAIRLFHLGEVVDRHAAEVLCGEALESLVGAGLLQLDGGGVRTHSLQLRFIDGVLLFTGLPSARFPLYFGDDSIGLLRRQRIAPGGKALDLCTGTGVQALKLAQMGGNVVGIDINPFAIQVARLNAQLNGVSERIQFRRADLWAGKATDERFDWISANPPMVPALPGGLYPLVGDGGDDGMDLTWRFLEGLPAALSHNGQAITLGVTWSDGVLPRCLEKLEAFAKAQDLGIRMTITRTLEARAGSWWHGVLKATYLAVSTMSEEAVLSALADQLDRNGASHAVIYFLNIHRSTGGSVDLIDMSPFKSQRLWDI